MSFTPFDSRDLAPAEARALQEELRGRVVAADRLGKIRTVAGVDVGFSRRGREARARAGVAVVSFPGLEPLDEAVAEVRVTFPYVPGLLSFRELPAVVRALEGLDALPDLLVCDAHGYAHPRRFGLACHLGVLTDAPTIGVAKSLLVGEHEELPPERASWRPLVDPSSGGEVIGAVLRT
ncbi:MAG: endonuclease V, partial [Thermoanaerobaculia bacterium]